MRFRNYIRGIFSVFGVLGAILLFMGIMAYSENIYAGVFYVIIGLSEIIIPVYVLTTGRKKRGYELGNLVVVGSWWILSIGIAGVALFTSPLFSVSTALTVASTGFAILWIVLGAVNIRFAISETGADLVV